MIKRLAVLGDKTTNGTLVSATSHYYSEGKCIAKSQDLATCSVCHGTFPVEGSCAGILCDGERLVQDRDRVLCRCPDHRVVAVSHYFIE